VVIEIEEDLVCSRSQLIVGHWFQRGSFSEQYGDNFALLGITQRVEAFYDLFGRVGHVVIIASRLARFKGEPDAFFCPFFLLPIV